VLEVDQSEEEEYEREGRIRRSSGIAVSQMPALIASGLAPILA
jgi:hypothetical protein